MSAQTKNAFGKQVPITLIQDFKKSKSSALEIGAGNEVEDKIHHRKKKFPHEEHEN